MTGWKTMICAVSGSSDVNRDPSHPVRVAQENVMRTPAVGSRGVCRDMSCPVLMRLDEVDEGGLNV